MTNGSGISGRSDSAGMGQCINSSLPQDWYMIGQPGGRVRTDRRSTSSIHSPFIPPILSSPTHARKPPYVANSLRCTTLPALDKVGLAPPSIKTCGSYREDRSVSGRCWQVSRDTDAPLHPVGIPLLAVITACARWFPRLRRPPRTLPYVFLEDLGVLYHVLADAYLFFGNGPRPSVHSC